MPYVSVRLAAPVAQEKKDQIISGITNLLQEVLNKPPAATTVVIDEVDPHNWGVGGETLAVKWGLDK
ncbi:MAG: 4-oxalocrotonate tautomerase family protein [Deltaproteobacteria bacterium]|nr:4-oxalocrotonate tautomerase family protein [Deltaproteobacteria bacterium]